MSEAIEFDEKEAAETERSYLTADIVATRAVVMELLAPGPGERVLDVGSGPGMLLRDIAGAVGPRGLAAGLDISESMMAIARHRCRDLDNVEIASGDATALPWPDGHFDRAVSTQVYEYVPDLAAAFAELNRVLKPGGRALIMATDADTILFGPAGDAVAARVHEAWPPHCAHPFLPRELGPLLDAAGFTVADRKVHVIVNHRFSPENFGWHVARSLSVYAAKQGAIAKEEGKAWVAGLNELDARSAFFFSMNRYLFLANKTTSPDLKRIIDGEGFSLPDARNSSKI
ncbi:MAG: methyltransferase domain-containing protein [Proteobacteria bacterium]|nr:methyltransferase domain-containing protein [Pseudomonadota bacterium]